MCWCYDGAGGIATEFFLAEEKSRHYFDDQKGKVDRSIQIIFIQLAIGVMMSHALDRGFFSMLIVKQFLWN